MRNLLLALTLVVTASAAACGSDDTAGTGTDRPDASVSDDSGESGGNDTTSQSDTTTTTDTGATTDSGTNDSGTDDSGSVDSGPGEDAGGTSDTGSTTDTGIATDTDTGTTTDVNPYERGTTSFTDINVQVPLSDGGTINAVLFVPDGAGPWPGAIINHGFQLSGSDFLSYGEHLASYGYIVLVPSFADTLLSARTHNQLAEDTIGHIDWLIAENSGGTLAGKLDESLIVAGGHSRGGKQSLLAAHRDSRIVASFNMDPVDSLPPTGGSATDFPSVAPELMPAVTIPTGYVGTGLGADAGPIPIGPPCAPEDENYAQYYQNAGGPAVQWVHADAGHNDFIDGDGGLAGFACPSGPDKDDVRSFTRAAMVAFYEYFVRSESAYGAWFESGSMPSNVSVQTRNL